MKVLIIGAAGMIGRKLTARLVRDGTLAGRAITHAHLVDVVAPQPLANPPFPVALDAFDIAAPYVAPKLVAPRPDIIFLLASVVSGEAEADFDKGYAINVGGTHALFEAIRRE
jgi:D-erythronate 2-dehydrogenase